MEDNTNNICARPTLRLAEGVFLPKMKNNDDKQYQRMVSTGI